MKIGVRVKASVYRWGLSIELLPVFGHYCLPAYFRCQRLGFYICFAASSEMKSMGILFRFSVFFAGMVGLHSAEEMCKPETHFQSGEDMGLFLPLGSCTIFLHVTS